MTQDKHTPDKASEARQDRVLSLIVWALFVLAVIWEIVWPRSDLLIAQRYFFAPGVGFKYAQLPWVQVLYHYTPPVGRAAVLVGVVICVLGRLSPQWVSPLVRRTALAFVLSAALSSGILVTNLLKPGWSRPRPVHVLEFGGHEAYRAPLQPCAWCASEYSFVSGHATAGFTLMSLGLLAGATWRRRWLILSVLLGGIIGWGRMAQGAHFFSDIVFAFFAVWVSCELVRWWMRRGDTLGA